MILLPPVLLKQIVDAAEAAFPEECCGLIVGRSQAPDRLLATRLAVSDNVATDDRRQRFEIDPRVRLRIEREVRGGPERVIGVYHSHPGHRAQPSLRDLSMAFEPDLVWLITSVIDGQAVHTTAHALDADGRQFHEVPLRTDDWTPYDVRGESGSDRDGP